MKTSIEKLISDFNQTVGKEKDIIVEGIPDAGLHQHKADIHAGKPVDMIEHVYPTLDEGRLTFDFKAFEDVFPKDELEAHFVGIDEDALKLGKIDGKRYGLAFTFSTPLIYINDKLFEQAGLDPNKPPTTWDEVKEYALKIKEKTKKYGLGLSPANDGVTEDVLGTDLLSKEQSEALFTNAETIEAITAWQSLYHSGSLAIDSYAVEQFMAGNLGMVLTTSEFHSGMTNAADQGGWTLNYTPLPQLGDKSGIPIHSESALVVRP